MYSHYLCIICLQNICIDTIFFSYGLFQHMCNVVYWLITTYFITYSWSADKLNCELSCEQFFILSLFFTGFEKYCSSCQYKFFFYVWSWNSIKNLIPFKILSFLKLISFGYLNYSISVGPTNTCKASRYFNYSLWL